MCVVEVAIFGAKMFVRSCRPLLVSKGHDHKDEEHYAWQMLLDMNGQQGVEATA